MPAKVLAATVTGTDAGKATFTLLMKPADNAAAFHVILKVLGELAVVLYDRFVTCDELLKHTGEAALDEVIVGAGLTVSGNVLDVTVLQALETATV